jgi:EcsC protein family
MTEAEVLLPGRLALDDETELQRAVRLLEAESLASRFTRALGGHVEALRRLLPSRARHFVGVATESALKTALKVSLRTLRADGAGAPSSERWHKTAAGLSGAIGGAFGIAALAVELPISTTILLRSIADIARSEGEDLADPAAGIACLEVFALDGGNDEETGVESGYFASRILLAQSVSESARFLLRAGVAGETAPVMVRLVSQVASRFGVAVSQKVVAQSAPVLGAIGGATINAAFADHFQALARGHFIVRRLERRYGAEMVRAAFERTRQSLGSRAGYREAAAA